MSPKTNSMVLRTFVSLLVAGLVGCGGSGIVPGTDATALRPLPADYLTRKAVAYGPNRTGNTATEIITEAEILQDLTLLVQGEFKLIRLYTSSDMVSRQTLDVIKANGLDIKVHLGCWINSDQYATAAQAPAIEQGNQEEIARCIALANTYPGIVETVSVGNECMVSWAGNPVTPARMTGYLKQVRSAVPQPVTTDDNYAFFASAPTNVLNTLDFVSLHTYAVLDTLYGLWDWQQTGVGASTRASAMMAAGLAWQQENFAVASTYLKNTGYGALPIVIGETGWKAVPTGGEVERAHPVNQKLFFNLLNTWHTTAGGPGNIFWFEAFDEPWKGNDDGWGLFDVSRKARYAVQSLYPASQWEAGAYTDAQALYYLPTVPNPAVTASPYTVYAETVTAGEARPAESLSWQGWSGSSATPTTTTAEEGTTSMAIVPNPVSWGWGMAYTYTGYSDDLSAFGAGTFNFSIKTTYPGLILVGFQTGDPVDLTQYNVFIPIGSGAYGYYNDGQWHNVSIPISAMLPWGAMASGMTLPAFSKLDLTKVTTPFVLADVYGTTGKANNAGSNAQLFVDAIHWSK